MINNNPYSIPDRSSQKNSIPSFTDESTSFLQKSDSVDYSHKLSSPSQYINRNHHPPIPNNTTGNLKKSAINLDDTSQSFGPPFYQTVTQNTKHFLPSPKNQASSPTSQIGSYINLSGSRGHIAPNSPRDRKSTGNPTTLRESFGMKSPDQKINSKAESKEVNEKLDILSATVIALSRRLDEI